MENFGHVSKKRYLCSGESGRRPKSNSTTLLGKYTRKKSFGTTHREQYQSKIDE